MISTLMICSAVMDENLTPSNGYLLLSALARELSNTGSSVFFSETSPQPICSPIFPISFWLEETNEIPNRTMFFSKGDIAAARISFLRDEQFDIFAEKIRGATLTLGGAGFNVQSVSIPGENPFSKYIPPQVMLLMEPAEGVAFDFLTPTGFKTSGIQYSLPDPEIFFDSISAKWIKNEQPINIQLWTRKILIDKFAIKSTSAFLKDGVVFRGFTGRVTYDFRNCPIEHRKWLTILSEYAFYCGAGYKVSQGMGQVVPHFFSFKNMKG